MHTATTPSSRPRAGLAVVLAVLAAALALPSAASADQFCGGTLKKLPRTEERTTGVGYDFRCNEPATGFFLVSSEELISFDVTADVFGSAGEGGALRPDDRFGTCEGSLPGLGFGCSGTYSALGRTVHGAFDTTGKPCARDKTTRRVLLRASIIALSAKGQLTGPYALSQPKCPRPPKRKRSAS